MTLIRALAFAGRRIVAIGALLGLVILSPAARADVSQSPSRNVLDYGAKGDGAQTETTVIQGAIDACAVAGGCTLHFPAGRYVSGTLFLRDNITLNLAPGAVLATSGRAEDYPAPALIYAKGVTSVALTGDGEIQAGPVPAPDETTIRNPGSRLVSLLLVENATNVRVSGVRFLRSPVWTVTLRVVDGAWLENLLIDNALLAPNNNGIVLDSSTRVTVRGLHYRGGGDGITLQTSLVDGVAPPCANITISDSTLRSASMAIKIGTTTHGNIHNVVVSNTIIEASQGGVGVFVRDGGTVESLQFANLVVETAPVRRDRAEWPIVLDLKRRSQESTPGELRGITFANTQVRTGGKILFSGMTGHPIRGLRVNGLSLTRRDPATTVMRNQRPWKSPVDSVSGEDETSSAILAGYLADSDLSDVRIRWEMADPVPESHALFVHSVDGILLNGISARQSKVGGSLAAMQFLNSRNIEIRNSTAPPQTGIWIQAQGVPKQEFFVFGNSTGAAYREIVYGK